MSDDKKPSRRLGYGLAILRHLQWFSALLASFGLVKLHGDVVPGTKGRKIDVIPYLDSALLFYSLFLLGYVLYCSLARRLGKAWFAWGVVSVSGDFHMIGLLLAKIIIIGSSKLPEKCHDVIREKYFQNELRDHHPFRELAKSIFRIGSFMGRDEVDQQCYTSFVVFWLSALTIITYILSIILTIVRLHKYRKALNSPVEADGSGRDTEMAMETTSAPGVGRVSRHLSRSRASSVGSNASSTKKDKSHPNNTPPPSYRSRLSQETTWSYHANLATVSDGFSAGEPPSAPRVSMETTYSVAVNRCLVSDGFGQSEQLPEYSSRPASPVRYPGT